MLWRNYRRLGLPLQGNVEQIDFLQNISRQVVDEFSDISRIIDGIKFIIRKVTFTLKEFKQELAKREAQLAVLGDVCVDFE